MCIPTVRGLGYSADWQTHRIRRGPPPKSRKIRSVAQAASTRPKVRRGRFLPKVRRGEGPGRSRRSKGEGPGRSKGARPDGGLHHAVALDNTAGSHLDGAGNSRIYQGYSSLIALKFVQSYPALLTTDVFNFRLLLKLTDLTAQSELFSFC
jgi:hypothetical protein